MELLQRFADGDLDAFESLFRQFQGEVYSWIVRIVRDPAAAEDLTVETFWRVYRARARFDPARSFGAWARRIATNAAVDYMQSRRPETELPERFAAAPEANPGIRREQRDSIRRAFRALPAKLQVAATLALIEERDYGEIASALGASKETVKSRVFRATRLLREKLKRMGWEP
jgi:RNA polymerase sigma-70 factor (ECF subfamily)